MGLKTDKLVLKSELAAETQKLLNVLIPNLSTNKNVSPQKSDLIKRIFSQDALETIKENKLVNIPEAKSFKEVAMNFFGMNSLWSNPRNWLGFFMVHAPEYPTYLIPAFTQARATGDAKELKKGEGYRGLFTGGLEGIAVGALVSGNKLRTKEMIPYIILGAGLQLFSSKFFPWVAEKAGRAVYNKNLRNQTPPQVAPKPEVLEYIQSLQNNKPMSTYNFANSSRLKV